MTTSKTSIAGRRLAALGLGALVLLTPQAGVAQDSPAIDHAAWLADLEHIRTAIELRYPNLEWLTKEREISLDRWFDRTAQAITASESTADARQALETLIDRFQDGHVVLTFFQPEGGSQGEPTGQSAPSTPAEFCAIRGYDRRQVTRGTAASLPGYRAISADAPFPSGMVESDGKTVGVVRIGVFSPQGYPMLCEQALANLSLSVDTPCDETCEDRVLTEVYALMTRELLSTTERLKAEGVDTLLVDVSRNGGGTEWAEAAARIVSPIPIRSAPIRVIRDETWVARWTALADRLGEKVGQAEPADRALLIDLIERAEVTALDLAPCPEDRCSRTALNGFATGLLPELPAGTLAGRPWGPLVFSPAQFPYQDAVWNGPLLVLVDDQTWSAAEQFAAVLQDNRAAVIVGTRTGGAGCGSLYGNEPVRLPHSGARLSMPNCARIRRDGTNEVSGVIPDVATGVRWNDGPAQAGRTTATRLPEALRRSDALIVTATVLATDNTRPELAPETGLPSPDL